MTPSAGMSVEEMKAFNYWLAQPQSESAHLTKNDLRNIISAACADEREKWWKLGQWQGWESSAALAEDEKKRTHKSHSKTMLAQIIIDHIRIDQNTVPIERRTIGDAGVLLESSEGGRG